MALRYTEDMMISIGDNAPQFTLSTNGGGQFSLADAAGKYLIL